MTDKEKIEQVEVIFRGGHTKPPHYLWYYDKERYKSRDMRLGLHCFNDIKESNRSTQGICEICLEVENEHKED